MKKNVARGMLAAVVTAVFGVGLLAVATPAAADNCEAQCYQGYQQCVPYCSKHPCLVSCETALEHCLSNCGATE